MAADESLGFFFNVEKFFGSMSAQRMSFSEKGVYLVMLFQQWRDKQRNLPDDPKAVAELIAVTPVQGAELEAAWDVVRRKFVTSKHDPERIYNVEVEKTRTKQRLYYKEKREAGREGGFRSGVKRRATRDLRAKQNETVLQKNEAPFEANEARREEKSREEKRVLDPAPARPTDEDATRRFVQETYPEKYAKCRSGAFYRVNEAKDFEVCVELVATYGDRIGDMLELFLRLPPGKDVLNTPGTPRQFAHMAPTVDTELRKHGR